MHRSGTHVYITEKAGFTPRFYVLNMFRLFVVQLPEGSLVHIYIDGLCT